MFTTSELELLQSYIDDGYHVMVRDVEARVYLFEESPEWDAPGEEIVGWDGKKKRIDSEMFKMIGYGVGSETYLPDILKS